ncbi:hypothetical protein HMN09_01148100 [Mycena chlorophos]|uniref:Uncharacterized protein n=1 Tax=Mycena chlorophos TaxID=658473 RepID=A0A8H6VUA1_MYCCL|nr:hypothetical protein HMN09_01148100 [Mycena chlorophos]
MTCFAKMRQWTQTEYAVSHVMNLFLRATDNLTPLAAGHDVPNGHVLPKHVNTKTEQAKKILKLAMASSKSTSTSTSDPAKSRKLRTASSSPPVSSQSTSKSAASAPKMRKTKAARPRDPDALPEALRKFPFSFEFNNASHPPVRGTNVEGKGIAPLYVLAWALDPLYMEKGPADRNTDYVWKWAQNIKANPPGEGRRIVRPAVFPWLGGFNDNKMYYVCSSNNRDPSTVTLEDIQYARDALPVMELLDDFDYNSVLKWYRTTSM